MGRDDTSDLFRMTRPGSFIAGMVLFLMVVALIATALLGQIIQAFHANPFLNGLILGVLLIGILYSFLQVSRLVPAIRWVEDYRMGDPGALGPAAGPPPNVLAPMAAMLRDRQGVMSLSAIALRSILDSIGSRLDESREIARYMIGLLIFLGLLGTFWGLLHTITAVGESIRTLSFNEAPPEQVFGDLITGLEAPLSGMGIAFSSSLFGLAGSLVLGFLDLRAGQAQNRFYNELEEYLSTRTQVHNQTDWDNDPIEGMAEPSLIPTPNDPRTTQSDTSMSVLVEEVRSLRKSLEQKAAPDETLVQRLVEAIENLPAHSDEQTHTDSSAAQDLREAAADLKTAVHKFQIDGPAEQKAMLHDIRDDVRVLTKTLISIFERAAKDEQD